MEPWNSDVPNLAFDNDALLNIICAISALHTVKCNPRDLEAIDAYRNYLNFALREHSNDVAHLTKMNADAACLSSSLIQIDEAYASTLSYIGSAKSAIKGGEKPQTVCRVLMLFPYLIKRSFIDLIEEQRPRALVILAHYFGLLAHFKHIWFIGDTGSREIRAIQTVLSEEWQELMTWPLQMLAEGSSSAEKSWS